MSNESMLECMKMMSELKHQNTRIKQDECILSASKNCEKCGAILVKSNNQYVCEYCGFVYSIR